MSTARLTSRALRMAIAPRAAIATRAATSTLPPSAVRSLTISYPRFKSDVVTENTIPVSVYDPASKTSGAIHKTIPVKPEDRQVPGPAVPPTNEMENLSLLSDEVYKKLPATVRSMTVKDKVFVITG